MPIQTGKYSRSIFIFYSLILMLGSLLVSRAALSISLIIFVCAATLHKGFWQQVNALFRNKFLFLISLLFFIPLISGLWSSDKDQWLNVVRLKLPFLFLPLAFAGDWKLSEKKWLILFYVFLITVFAGSLWSLLHYFSDAAAYNEAYLKAKTFDTPLENDHVRFSWLVSVAALSCFLLFENSVKKIHEWLIISLLVFFIAYLHLLAARMGLLCFYICCLLLVARYFLVKKKVTLSYALGASLILLPLLSWLAFPSFQNRIKYLVYDLENFQSGGYTQGSNDGARILSVKAGWHMLQQNPFGAGAGDIIAETDKWYQQNVPQIIASDKFHPSNEWLMYGGFAGWPGVIIFSIIIFFPLFIKNIRHRFYWLSFNIIATFSFLFDMSLEVQYGIFLYSFILLWWYKWFKDSADAS